MLIGHGFFKKWAIPSLFFIYFRLFKQTINWSCFSEHPNESILFHYNMGSYATLKFLVNFGCIMTCKPLETSFFLWNGQSPQFFGVSNFKLVQNHCIISRNLLYRVDGGYIIP